MSIYATLSFSNGAVDRQPRRVVLTQSEFQHELAVIEVPSFSVDSKRYQTGTPVTLAWGTSPTNGRTFVGYVSHTEPVYRVEGNEDGETDWRKVVCVGATFVLKDGDYSGYKDVSVPTVVRAICERYRLDASHVQTHARVFGSLSQNGRSFWDFLVDLAQKIGYVLYARGTSLYFHDRLSAVSNVRGNIPAFSPKGGGLNNFKSQIGATTPTGGDLFDRFGFGVNAETGAVITAQRKAVATRPVLGRVPYYAVHQRGDANLSFGSAAEGDDALAAKALSNQLPISAKIEVGGHTNVRVGGVVQLNGLDLTNSGLWYVKHVRHEITPKSYITTAEIGRDATTAVTLPPTGPALVTNLERGSRLNGLQWVVA